MLHLSFSENRGKTEAEATSRIKDRPIFLEKASTSKYVRPTPTADNIEEGHSEDSSSGGGSDRSSSESGSSSSKGDNIQLKTSEKRADPSVEPQGLELPVYEDFMPEAVETQPPNSAAQEIFIAKLLERIEENKKKPIKAAPKKRAAKISTPVETDKNKLKKSPRTPVHDSSEDSDSDSNLSTSSSSSSESSNESSNESSSESSNDENDRNAKMSKNKVSPKKKKILASIAAAAAAATSTAPAKPKRKKKPAKKNKSSRKKKTKSASSSSSKSKNARDRKVLRRIGKSLAGISKRVSTHFKK